MNVYNLILSFILGTCVGSFLNVLIDRLPQEQSLIHPGSHCATCGKKLNAFELIPVVSYLWLKGRCHHCGAGIPRRILAVELGTGLLFVLLSLNYGLSIKFLVLAFYACLFLILTVIDLEHGLILNKIIYPAMGISLFLSPFWPSLGFPRAFLGANSMLHGFLGSLTGGAIFALPLFLIALFYSDRMGWGDVKMAAQIGLTTSFPSVLAAMLVAFVSGGLTAGCLLLLRRKGWKEGIPFGPFLALGALVALLWGEDLIAWYLKLMGII